MTGLDHGITKLVAFLLVPAIVCVASLGYAAFRPSETTKSHLAVNVETVDPPFVIETSAVLILATPSVLSP